VTGVFLYGYARSPFGRHGGGLSGYDPGVLGGIVVDALLVRAGVPPEAVGLVSVGVGMLGGAQLTCARQVVLRSSLPQETPSIGFDRACCSGLTAITSAAAEIRGGTLQSAIAGGVDVLSRTPRLLPRFPGDAPGSWALDDPLLLGSPFSETTIAAYTSREALAAGVTREHQDAWALRSHEKYWQAQQQGYFDAERVSVPARERSVRAAPRALESDESPRRDSSLEALAHLRPVRGSETITAGNAPGLSDGAAFVLLGSGEFGRECGLTPLARLGPHARVAESPTSGTRTPALAIQRVLRDAGANPESLSLLEINEAFAATPLVSTLALCRGDVSEAARLRERTNVHGGAVAIGHPLGASGARLVMTLASGLARTGGNRGAAAICGGYGQGEALLLETP
jgi:acetyl-CoA C-acetyltransferase